MLKKDNSCLFCAIVSKDIHAFVVLETKWSVAFLDTNPLANGHTLIVPKSHFELFEDLPEEYANDLIHSTSEIASKVIAALGMDGSTIAINNGKASGQAVPHVHVHVIPRKFGDCGGSIHSIMGDVNLMDGKNLIDVANRIKHYLEVK